MATLGAMHNQSGYGQDGRQQQKEQGFSGYNQPAAKPIIAADVSASYFADDPNNLTGASSLTSYAQAFSSMSGVGTISQPAQANVSMESDYPRSTSSPLDRLTWIVDL
ncbi:hypothetical protein B0T11DRAFT_327567 [Plectosphaerella cucumerina]|uniref:Uncharacterized protein n=1 Tax=Plectosphaerella cucumerina TaxID=40658 RepID=A0A8K0TNC8_9PEZI|nr:hypothetical protein B0T11DRAFT_327567 [Plectosphaerella cucumerina]